MSRASPQVGEQPSASTPAASEQPPSYRVKWLVTPTITTPILLQNQNGPCALLALANAMLLTGHTTIRPGTTELPEADLMSMLADWASRPPASVDPQREHAVADFLDLLPRLTSGMTINVRFTSPTAFEFTREVGVFDIFPLRLLHGWLVDPQDAPLAAALGNLTYNQVVDELVATAPEVCTSADPSAPPPEAFEEPDEPEIPPPQESPETVNIREMRPAVMDFFDCNPTQLTVYGLTELHSSMHDNETAILFRNSHFYVVRKHKGEIYTLVTDEGYLRENCVWEKLMDVNGDSTFYNAQFHKLSPDGRVIDPTPTSAGTSTPQSSTAPSDKGPSSRYTRPAQTAQQRPMQSNAYSGSVLANQASDCSGTGFGRRKRDDKCVIQ